MSHEKKRFWANFKQANPPRRSGHIAAKTPRQVRYEDDDNDENEIFDGEGAVDLVEEDEPSADKTDSRPVKDDEETEE